MKAWVQSKAGLMDDLAWCEVQPPQPGPRQARIRLAAAALNPHDLLMLRGVAAAPQMPWIPGIEFSGRIDAIGPHSRWRVGERVCGVVPQGAMAEWLLAGDDEIMAMPMGMEFTLAACLPVAFTTAHLALHDGARIEAQQQVVVLGASGPLGLATLQLGSLRGARMIAVAHQPEKSKACVLHGASATYLIDDDGLGWESLAASLQASNSPQVHAVIDYAGLGLPSSLLDHLAWRARYVCAGFAGGQVPEISVASLMPRQVSVHTVLATEVAQREPERIHQIRSDLYNLGADNRLRAMVAGIFPLAEAPQALAALEAGGLAGKILLVP